MKRKIGQDGTLPYPQTTQVIQLKLGSITPPCLPEGTLPPWQIPTMTDKFPPWQKKLCWEFPCPRDQTSPWPWLCRPSPLNWRWGHGVYPDVGNKKCYFLTDLFADSLGLVLETIDLNRKLGGYDLFSAGPDLCVPLVLFQEASAIHYLLRNLTHLSTKVDHHAKESHHQAQPLLSYRSHVELKNLDKI